jgi:XTP/dITP diphosphohydrolase
MKHQLVFATHNRDKVGEFMALLQRLPVEIRTLDDFPSVGDIQEDADSLEENAEKKAVEVFQKTGLPSLADDSGLEVYYLGGEPGVHSSRYAGANASYEDNCKKLLSNMRGVPPRRRAARFRCALCFIAAGNVWLRAEGLLPGSIIEAPRGSNGFGYDPIFLPNGSPETLAEMDPVAKNRISHRARAIENILPSLQSHFSTLK